MKRDMELIRSILMQSEEKGPWSDIAIEGRSAAELGYHCYLIADAGLAKGVDVTSLDSKAPEWSLCYLTWAGHDFLDAAREPARWEKAKRAVSRMGSVSMGVLVEILKQLMIEQMKSVLPGV